MISIIIPLYNQAHLLPKCLESIKHQTTSNYEVIVVNDRSTDRLSKVIKQAKKDFGYKIEFMHNKTNHGAPYTRNKGGKKARGEFLLFCDADIIMNKNMLKIMQITLNETSNASYTYSSFKFGHKIFKLWPFDKEKLRQMPYIHTTSLIRKEHFPRFDENITRLQDWDLWLTMLEQGHTGIWIDKILFKVHTGGTMSSWMPSLTYKLFPFLPKVKRYKYAVKKIKEKHNIS